MNELKYGNNKNVMPKKLKEIIVKKCPLFSENKAAHGKDLFFNLIDNLLNELNDGTSKEASNSEELDLSNKIAVYNEVKNEIDKNNIIK